MNPIDWDNPRLKFLLIFSFLLAFNFILGVTSLMWFEGVFINIFLIFIILTLPIVALVRYKSFKHPVSKLLLIIFSIFWLSYFSQKIVKRQIEKSSERKGELLVEKLEDYIKVHKKYPKNIDGEEFQDLNLTHMFISKISYFYISDIDYFIQFPTFQQSVRIRGKDGDWFYND